MNTEVRSLAAMYRITVTSWKPITTVTACAVIRPLVTITGICYVLEHITDNM